MSEKLLSDLRDLERSYGNMRVQNVGIIREAISRIEHLEKGLKRLASPESFVISRMTNEEERARMVFADDILEQHL